MSIPKHLTRAGLLTAAMLIGNLTGLLAQDKTAALPKVSPKVPPSKASPSTLEWPAGFAVPRPSKPTVTVNITYLVGSRHEDLRRNGHGPPAGAHGVQRIAKHTNIPQELTSHGARPTAPPGRPHQLFRNLCRYRRKPEMGARPGSRPDDELVHQERDLESEFTVVRNEFEMGENNPTEHSDRARGLVPPFSGITTAIRPLAPESDIEKYRSTACKHFTTSTTSPTMPYWWWPAKLTRPKRWRW